MALKQAMRLDEAVVSHPSDPDVQVTLKRPSRLDVARYFARRKERFMAQPLVRADTGDVIRKGDGDAEFVVLPLDALELDLEYLKKYILAWAGLQDARGNPFGKFSAASVEILFEDGFDVITEGEDGKEERQSFGAYLFGRLLDPSTFDPDPKA